MKTNCQRCKSEFLLQTSKMNKGFCAKCYNGSIRKGYSSVSRIAILLGFISGFISSVFTYVILKYVWGSDEIWSTGVANLAIYVGFIFSEIFFNQLFPIGKYKRAKFKELVLVHMLVLLIFTFRLLTQDY